MRSVNATCRPVVLVAASLLVACDSQNETGNGRETLPAVAVTNNFYKESWTWTDRLSHFHARILVTEHHGKAVVCGSYAISGHSRATLTKEAARYGQLMLNGEVIFEDFTRFTEVAEEGALVGSMATCLPTGADWPESKINRHFKLNYSKLRFRGN